MQRHAVDTHTHVLACVEPTYYVGSQHLLLSAGAPAALHLQCTHSYHDWYVLPTVHSAANPVGCRCCHQSMGQTDDGWTTDLHKLCSAYYVGSVNKTFMQAWVLAAWYALKLSMFLLKTSHPHPHPHRGWSRQVAETAQSHYFRQVFNICWFLCCSIWLTFVTHLWFRSN